MLATRIAAEIDAEISAAAQPALGGMSYLDFLAIAQADYFRRSGRYWQGAPLCPSPPSDAHAEQTTPDARPSDVAESWRDVLPAVPASVISQPRVDVLRRPGDVWDYELSVQFICGGVTYQKIFTGRDAGEWMPVGQASPLEGGGDGDH